MQFRKIYSRALFCLAASFSLALFSCTPSSEGEDSGSVEVEDLVAVPEPIPAPAPPRVLEIATPEELKPLRLQYPPRFRACEPYRDKIASAVRKHWGVFQFSDAWAAQLYQESLCNPLARSHVGAAGLAQFMPRTWIEVAAQLNLPPGSTPHEDIAIDAGAYYMARMMRTWSSPRPDFERTRLAQASYNAGAGNIINAQRACNGARDWRNIETCLHLITGRNAEETRTYVERIERWWLAMFGCEPFAAPRDLQAEWGC